MHVELSATIIKNMHMQHHDYFQVTMKSHAIPVILAIAVFYVAGGEGKCLGKYCTNTCAGKKIRVAT